MIAVKSVPRHTAVWQRELAQAVVDPVELLNMLGLAAVLGPAQRTAHRQFPLRVPRPYVARMNKHDPADPLLRQVLPSAEETRIASGFCGDPLGERQAMAAPGVLHKYRGRVLLIATGACGIHCRYCFRREFPYAQAQVGAASWKAALRYLEQHADVHEVILSGGDPLTLSNRRLALLIDGLAGISHIRRLRIHSRQPIVLPERIDDGLLELLSHTSFQAVMVVHANHPQEIDQSVRSALGRLAAAGVTLFNQAVLLRAVNDSADTLAALSEALFTAQVIPYYLHQLDRVRGAAHFEVPEQRAVALLQDIRARLPGYLVPRLVREDRGATAKTFIQ
jgi:EF-P beta-lysylation protein EpmB